MEQLGEDLGFVIMAVIGSLAVGMTLGQQVLYWLLLLILTGMILVNWRKLDALVKGVMQNVDV